MSKKKGFKVKRRHKSYSVHKSTGRKVLEVIITIVIIGGLVFLGYSVAPTLIKFFSGQMDSQNSDINSERPTQSSVTESETSKSETTASTESTTTEKQESSAPAKLTSENYAYAPESALASASALESFLKEAKKNGADSVIFSLKNNTGEILYKSANKTAAGYSGILAKAKLTASEIVNACKANELVPVAEMSTIYDRLLSKVLSDGGYTGYSNGSRFEWLDNRPESGGKPWANPLSESVRKYSAELTDELAKAGFERVILKDTIYPAFRSSDYNLVSADYRNKSRSDYLAMLLSLSAAAKADVTARIEAEDILTLGVTDYSASAEILNSKDKLGECGICVYMPSSLVGKKITLKDNKTLQLDKDAVKSITQAYTEIAKTVKPQEVTVIVEKGSLDAGKITSIVDALSALSYKEIIII